MLFARSSPLALPLALIALVAAGALLACSSEVRSPRTVGGRAPTRTETPSCAKGKFSGELDALMPALVVATPVPLYPATGLNRSIEPGCVVPFHDQPGEQPIDVAAVQVWTAERGDPRAKQVLLGRGRLRVGRGALVLEATDDAGDPVLHLAIDGAHVTLQRKGAPAFDGDVDLAANDALPLPLDALIAAISRCDADEALLASSDGNVVEATRGGTPLWRTRWLDAGTSMAVDTSVACGASDARFAWRSVVGDTLPMLSVASARSKQTLIVMRQAPTMTEDWTDPGMGAGAR